jgi:response regulator RpfG family c-di-GMP phosphodiesterase
VPTETEVRTPQHNPAAISGNAIRVLVVDDNQDAVESLGLLLSLESYTVATALNGALLWTRPQDFIRK